MFEILPLHHVISILDSDPILELHLPKLLSAQITSKIQFLVALSPNAQLLLGPMTLIRQNTRMIGMLMHRPAVPVDLETDTTATVSETM